MLQVSTQGQDDLWFKVPLSRTVSSEVILSLLCAVGIVYFLTNLFTSSFLVSSFYNTTGLETNALVIFSLDLTFSYSILQKKKDLDVYVYACALRVFVCG